MKKLLYIIAFAALSLVGFTRADVSSVSVAPATQSAISGSIVTFTVTGTNETGDVYLKYVLPKTASYDVVYQNSNTLPVNTFSLSLGIEHDPIFFVAAHTNFSITITAKMTTSNRAIPSTNTKAMFASDMQISTILTSAMAEISPIADLMVTNILTGQNPIASGDIVSYLATIQNIGSTIATGITFVSTFPIPMFNVPIATFDGTNHAYNYINYPQDFVWSGNYLNNINPGETIVVMLRSPMMQNFAVGTSFSQTAKATTVSDEYTTGNNSAVATGIVESQPDVWVTKTLAPFTGFHQGDIVTYTITYGNSGGKVANDVLITDTMNGQVTMSATSFALGALPANSGGILIVTGVLNTTLTSGATFVNTATISTSTSEATTTANNNNIASATGSVSGIDGIVVSIIASNLTRPHLDNAPYGSGPDTMIQAASGDIIQFTMTYANNGNTVGTHATLKLEGTQGFMTFDTHFMSTLPTLYPGQTATIISTGTVGPRNYISFTPIAKLTHDIGQIVTDSVKITEPLVCGDGLLTRTEICDTEGNLGTVFSGQVCENQQGVCVLVTNAIINSACLTYQYTNPLGGLTTGQSCSYVNVGLSTSTCNSMTGSVPVQTTNGYDINYTCRGNNTTATTPISIDCGNGTTIIGSGSNLNGTCSYAGSFVGNAQCIVGNDANNSACRIPVSESQLQCDLEALDGRIILVDEDGEGQGRFRCETRDGADAQVISIDCGDNAIDGDASATNTSQIETICEYDENTLPEDAIVTCSTDEVICETENIIIDESGLGYCGNGIREGYEDCDDGDDNGSSSSECTAGCSLKNNGAAMIGCFNIGNNNISIQKGEMLPFRWNLENKKNIIAGNSCEGKSEGSIPEESIYCTFSIYNGEDTEEDGNPVYTTRKKCNEDTRGNSALFSYFTQQNGLRSLKDAFGKYFIDSDDFVKNIFGEYKIVLEKVEYDYCRDDEKDEGTQIDRVCSVNFAVTQPYLAQKNSFGITPKAANISLEGYQSLIGEELIRSTDLEDIMVLDESDYAGGNKIQTMMDAFITKYEKIAITVPTSSLKGTVFEGLDITVKVVPSQKIYLLMSDTKKTITLKNIKLFTVPFTIVSKNIDIVVKGNVDYNGMFLVKDGTIAFEKSDTTTAGDRCPTTQVVKGIFVTNDGFVSTESLANNDVTNQRCTYGGLYVKGILIGDNIENIVNSKRSQLNKWFYVSGGDASVKAARRNQIFNGASVLIEYSPSLRSALPPGASEFTKALEVYKQ